MSLWAAIKWERNIPLQDFLLHNGKFSNSHPTLSSIALGIGSSVIFFYPYLNTTLTIDPCWLNLIAGDNWHL